MYLPIDATTARRITVRPMVAADPLLQNSPLHPHISWYKVKIGLFSFLVTHSPLSNLLKISIRSWISLFVAFPSFLDIKFNNRKSKYKMST